MSSFSSAEQEREEQREDLTSYLTSVRLYREQLLLDLMFELQNGRNLVFVTSPRRFQTDEGVSTALVEQQIEQLEEELRSYLLSLTQLDDREQILSDMMLALRDGRIVVVVTSPTQLQSENSVSPASKKAILDLPVVKISEENKEECPICLMEYGKGEEVKEMPCKHKYHSDCIEKWLGMHGSCPFCRYKMPVLDNNAEGEEVLGFALLPEYDNYSVSDSDLYD